MRLITRVELVNENLGTPQTGRYPRTLWHAVKNETIIGHLPPRERCRVFARFSQGDRPSVAGSCLTRAVSRNN